jgi:acetyl esterase/lipase
VDARKDVRGVVGMAGPYDFLPLRDPKLETIFGPENERPSTQPINHVDGGAAPMRLLTGDKDSVVDPGNAVRLAAAIRARGGSVSTQVYPGLGHVSLLTSMSGMFRGRAPVLSDVAAFINGPPSPTTAADPSLATPQPAGA